MAQTDANKREGLRPDANGWEAGSPASCFCRWLRRLAGSRQRLPHQPLGRIRVLPLFCQVLPAVAAGDGAMALEMALDGDDFRAWTTAHAGVNVSVGQSSWPVSGVHRGLINRPTWNPPFTVASIQQKTD